MNAPIVLAAFASIAAALPAPIQAPPDPRAAPVDARATSVALARIASEHPDIAAVMPVAESRGGRKIEALRLATGDRAPGRPAILVVANLEGPHVWTTGLVLDEARELASRHASDATLQALLAATTVYLVPCANPDAAEARFAKPLLEQRATHPGVDDDRDGRFGEDGPSDVDGDGRVLALRQPDPEGDWIADPSDPRALVKADRSKGERGTWKLWVEGRDSDHDEKLAEDPLADVQVGRNFHHGWKEHAAESGTWALSEPEARGLADFVLAHRDIQLVLVYGAQDNLVEKLKTVGDDGGRAALGGTPESDGKLYAEIGRRYKELSGSTAKSEGDDHGTFQAWCQLQRGLVTLSVNPWSMPLDTEGPKSEEKKDEAVVEGKEAKKDDKKKEEKREPSDDAKRLRWVDAKSESPRFVPWKAFEHPELGTVEIGGWVPYALIEPPEGDRAAIAEKQREFLVTLGDVLARVKLVEVTAKDLGGMWEVKAVLSNEAYLPLATVAGRRTGALRPARVRIELPSGAKLVAGELQTLVRELSGSGGRKELTWLVLGAAPTSMRIEADTDCFGTARAVPTIEK